MDGSTGETVARVALSGVGTPRDVEAISIGPGNRIFVGDIGDNEGVTWPYVWIYELPEPTELKDQTVKATQYVVKYADGSRDAESMAVHPKTGQVYIIDKNEDGGHLYEGPGEALRLRHQCLPARRPVDLWATDAAFSPDGETLAVRGYLGGIWYDWNGGKIQRKGADQRTPRAGRVRHLHHRRREAAARDGGRRQSREGRGRARGRRVGRGRLRRLG